jgi:RNA polymerase sigma-70 factor (ECF subfamily)
MSLKQRSDEELYDMLRGGRDDAHAAFEEFYDRHSARLYTYCQRMMNNDPLAQDLFQETFIRFYDSVQKVENMTNAAAYLLRIARNLCLNERHRKHNNLVQLEEFHLPACHEHYESAELMQLVETAMETLPDDYREALMLKEQLGFSYNDIAEITGTTMPVIRTRIYRAKNKVRDILAPYLEDLQR